MQPMVRRRLLAMLGLVCLFQVHDVLSVEEASRKSRTIITDTEAEISSQQIPDPAKVVLHVMHGIALPWGKPGFRVTIRNWTPNGQVSIYAIGPGGESVELVSAEQPISADQFGDMTVDVDYERKGLKHGRWIIVVAGKLGAHVIRTDMPWNQITRARPMGIKGTLPFIPTPAAEKRPNLDTSGNR